MTTPLAVIHRGKAPYLPYILQQLRASNPESRIILLSDRPVPSCAAFTEYHDLKQYLGTAEKFTEKYRTLHRSYNSFFFENACFQRTFILEEFCRNNNLPRIWHLDSDVLVFSDLNRFIAGREFKYALVIPNPALMNSTHAISPHTACWEIEKLTEYNKFLLDCMNEHTEACRTLAELWEKHKLLTTVGGVSDMTSLYLFAAQSPTGLLDLNSISKTEKISYSDSLDSKEPGIRFLTSHMQGYSKWRIPAEYRGPRFKGKSATLLRLRIFQIKTVLIREIRAFLFKLTGRRFYC